MNNFIQGLHKAIAPIGKFGRDLATQTNKPVIDGEYIHYGSRTWLKSDWENAFRGIGQAFSGKTEERQSSDYDQPQAMYPEQ